MFIPHRDAFGFVELLASPQEQAPKFLKASKKDKAQVLKSSPAQAPSGHTSPLSSKGEKSTVPSQGSPKFYRIPKDSLEELTL